MSKTIPAFPIHNIEEAEEFYETKFGFACLYKNEEFAKLTRDDAELHLWAACDNSWKARGAALVGSPVRRAAPFPPTNSAKIRPRTQTNSASTTSTIMRYS